jgi:hypothetical protein
VGLEVVWVVSLKLVAASVEESVLLLPILEKEENENGGVDWLLPPWRKRRSFRRRGISVVERVGLKASWWKRGLELLRARWRESVERETCCRKKLGRRLVFSDFWTRVSPPSGHEIHLYL